MRRLTAIEIRERDAAKEIKTKNKAQQAKKPQRFVRQLVQQGKEHLTTPGREEGASEFATEQVEQSAMMVADELASDAVQGIAGIKSSVQQYRETSVREQMRQAFVEKEKKAAENPHQQTKIHEVDIGTADELKTPETRPIQFSKKTITFHRSITSSSVQQPVIRERVRVKNGPKEKSKNSAAAVKMRQYVEQPVVKTVVSGVYSTAQHGVTEIPTAKRMPMAKARQYAQKNLIQRPTRQISKGPTAFVQRIADAVKKTATAATGTIAGIAGGGVLLVVFSMLIIVAAVAASPFGILLTNEPSDGSVPLNVAVAQIQDEFTDRLKELQDGGYADIVLHSQLPDWKESVAVFACKTTGAVDGIDVMTLDPERVNRLKQVFWDMTELSTDVLSGDESVLHITVTPKSAEDMKLQYGFTNSQGEALDELLREADTLNGLLTDLTISHEAAHKLWENLPDNLSPERTAVVKAACSLVGKVNYFWGGKSLVIGWSSQWGVLRKVTADGSPTSGTYRPYGLDCSGFTDWVFYNASNKGYIIGHGGGAMMQHSYCEDIEWDDVQPGDLVFYPNGEHVGIVGGWNENGELLVIHCDSGANNVVITGVVGFVSVVRPYYYSE